MRAFNDLLDKGIFPLACSIEGWGAALAVGVAAAGIGSAVISGGAAQSAAQTQAGAANSATQAELSMFDTTQQNLAPWLGAGKNALSALDFGLGIGPKTGGAPGMTYGGLTAPFTAADYQKSPGYAFQMQQGISAVQNSASAAGGIGGGNTLRGLTQFGQGLANSDYQQGLQNYIQQQQQQYNMLSGVSGQGANAAANLGGFATQVGGQIGSNTIGAGNALAAGQIGVANAASGGINSLAQIAALYGNGAGGSQYPYGNNPYYSTGGGAPGQWEQNYNPTGPPAYTNSDCALKECIEPYYFDGQAGLMVYKFNYKGELAPHIGFIAQEVQEKYPHAVRKNSDGFLMVNYTKVPSEKDWLELDALGHKT